jgi:hypothetical protein
MTWCVGTWIIVSVDFTHKDLYNKIFFFLRFYVYTAQYQIQYVFYVSHFGKKN